MSSDIRAKASTLSARVRARRGAAKRSRGGAVSGLRSQWSAYPRKWKRDRKLNMDFETLGEEWGGPAFADCIVDELVAEYLGPDVDVLELGCGGGKFSQRLAPRVRSLICADISPQMIEQTRQELAARGVGDNVDFCVLNGVDFSGVPNASVDFIFSYDVQLHMQPQNVFSYMLDAQRVLRPGGVFMLHQIKLDSPGGIEHFQMQFGEGTWDRAFDSPKRLGHIYFMSADQMRALVESAGMAADRIVEDFPGRDSELWHVTKDRDIFGFIRPRPNGSRLVGLADAGARLLQEKGSKAVWVVLDDGERAAILSEPQFNRAGFDWGKIEQVSADEMAAIPQVERPLEFWE